MTRGMARGYGSGYDSGVWLAQAPPPTKTKELTRQKNTDPYIYIHIFTYIYIGIYYTCIEYLYRFIHKGSTRGTQLSIESKASDKIKTGRPEALEATGRPGPSPRCFRKNEEIPWDPRKKVSTLAKKTFGS